MRRKLELAWLLLLALADVVLLVPRLAIEAARARGKRRRMTALLSRSANRAPPGGKP
ncbi:MAG: hypothetical protein AB1486_23625 [Planctomycetota bacterium]